mgnify:CR=1 FL=1
MNKNTKKENLYEKIETKKTTPADGFVSKTIIQPTNIGSYGQYHKGYSIRKTYTTNNPKVTRIFAYSMCLIFLIIGVISLLAKIWFFGITFTLVSIFSFCKAKEDIDKIEKNCKDQHESVDFDSKK